MSRYIDADELKEVHEKAVAEFADYYTGEMMHGMNLVIQYATERAPSIDIVKCKDCKWRGIVGCCALDIVVEDDKPNDDDYCSYGEKKNE